jgi:hypothetical protein
MEQRAVYYANGLVELQDAPAPHHLRVGGYPELLAEHCELVDRVAQLEARLAQLEEAHAPGIIMDTSQGDMTAIAWKAYVGP